MRYWKSFVSRFKTGLERYWFLYAVGTCAGLVILTILIFGGGVFWDIWQILLLTIGYTLAWFLGSALTFIILGGENRPAMKMGTAVVLGLFTTILHAIACHFASNICFF